jgi:hypothetical protein
MAYARTSYGGLLGTVFANVALASNRRCTLAIASFILKVSLSEFPAGRTI